jgi:hypothetical protein
MRCAGKLLVCFFLGVCKITFRLSFSREREDDPCQRSKRAVTSTNLIAGIIQKPNDYSFPILKKFGVVAKL